MAERWHPGWGIALLRVVLGIVFFVHGWDELFGGAGVAGWTSLLAAERFGAAGATARAIALVELLGGLLLLVGWLTRWVAGLLFLGVLVALFAAYAEHGFFAFQPAGEWGYEYHLVLLAGLACLMLAGAGPLAVDDWLVGRWSGMRR